MNSQTLREQGELFGLFWQSFKHPFRLRVNDLIRVYGKLAGRC